MIISQGTPAQIEASDTVVLASEGASVKTVKVNGVETTTEMLVLHKKTAKGSNGSITFINGKLTAFVQPT